jgi:hypothetical protein
LTKSDYQISPRWPWIEETQFYFRCPWEQCQSQPEPEQHVQGPWIQEGLGVRVLVAFQSNISGNICLPVFCSWYGVVTLNRTHFYCWKRASRSSLRVQKKRTVARSWGENRTNWLFES